MRWVVLTGYWWFWFNIMFVAVGLFTACKDQLYPAETNCHAPLRRIEFVVPGYRVGCWLGQAAR